ARFQLGTSRHRPDEPEKRAVRFEARHAVIEYVAVLAVVSAEPVFHGELAPRVESVRVRGETALDVGHVHAFHPAVPELLFERAAGEGKPAVVEKVAAL